MIVLAVFAAIAIERLLLIVMNLSDLRHHPQWLLAIAMVHHPLLAGVGIMPAALLRSWRMHDGRSFRCLLSWIAWLRRCASVMPWSNAEPCWPAVILDAVL